MSFAGVRIGKAGRGALVVAIFLFCALPVNAKTITLNWKPKDFATVYEIVLKQDEKPVLRKKNLKAPTWSGDLDPGVYFYQVRALDRLGRGGKWSSPKSLVVTPEAAELSAPAAGKVLSTYKTKIPVSLEWKVMPAVSEYKVTLKQDENPPREFSTTEPKLEVPDLVPGKYSWSIVAVIKPKGRAPAQYRTKTWETKPSEPGTFSIEKLPLEKVMLHAPLNRMLPPKDRLIHFSWSKVTGAEKYRLTILRRPAAENQAQDPKPIFEKTYAENAAAVHLPKDGNYEWQVAALTDDVGPVSTAQFVLDRDEKRWRFTPALGILQLTDKEPGVFYHLLATAVDVDFAYRLGERWQLGGDARLTAASLSSNNPEVSTRFYSLDAGAGYLFSGFSRWSFSLGAGMGYDAMSVTDGEFGISALLYPQVFANFRQIGSGGLFSGKVEVASLAKGIGSIGFSNLKVAGGISYDWAISAASDRRMKLFADFASLDFEPRNLSYAIHVTTLTFGLGLAF